MQNDGPQTDDQTLQKGSVEYQSKKVKHNDFEHGLVNNALMNEIINLDVGGVRFKTTRQTLSFEPSSMLSRMFSVDSERPPGIMTDGAYFLDRQPEVFKEILRYLRSGTFVPPNDKRMIQEMKIECDYFGLEGLKSWIKMSNPQPDDELIVNCRGTRFRTTRETLTKYDSNRDRDPDDTWNIGERFIEMFDGRSARKLLPERDGSYTLDMDPTFVSEYVIPMIQIDLDDDIYIDRETLETQEEKIVNKLRKNKETIGDISWV